MNNITIEDIYYQSGLRYFNNDLKFLIQNVLIELYRIFKPDGVLSIEKNRTLKNKFLAEIEKIGFKYLERKGRIFLFKKV